MTTLYFHGGRPDLKRGEFILPPTITGARSCSDFGGAAVHRRDRVYVASVFEAALMFACLHPSRRGWVYQVEPIGVLEQDPDYLGESGLCLSWQCERARIVRCHKVDPALRAQVNLTVVGNPL